jgi:hypothetical protein
VVHLVLDLEVGMQQQQQQMLLQAPHRSPQPEALLQTQQTPQAL